VFLWGITHSIGAVGWYNEIIMVQAVVFDCFGVLTTDTWRAFVDSLPEELKSEAHSLNNTFDRGQITKDDFIKSVNQLCGRMPPLAEDNTRIVKNLALLEYIGELRARELKIGLLSNVASNWIRDTFLTAEEQSLFDEMVLSFEVGITKPDPRIFQLICEKLAVKTSDAIMVDDIERYCEVAEEVGMKSVVYIDLVQTKKTIESLISQ